MTTSYHRLCAAALLLASVGTGCIQLETEPAVRTRREDKTVEKKKPEGPAAETEEEGVLWISGVEYPADYDWRRDTAAGTTACRLLLFRNAEKAVSLAVGPKERVSAEPDRHQILDGHLYTDDAAEGTTVVKRDGAVAARWQGEELVCGICMRKDGLWTLGLGKSGKGVFLRKNGEAVYTDPEGVPLGWQAGWARKALYEDAGQLCFAYRKQAPGTGGTVTTDWLVRDGAPTEVLSGKGCTLREVCRQGGRVHLLYERSAKFEVRVTHGEKDIQIGTAIDRVTGSRFKAGNGRLWVQGLRSRWLGKEVCCVWDENGKATEYPSGIFIRECFPGEEKLFAVGETEAGKTLVFEGKTRLEAGDNLYLMSESCACATGNSFYAVFTSRKPGGKAVCWRDGSRAELEFNGYLTGIVWQPR